ncbi:ArnT family glycosyltransferase [Flexilinea flocculi]|mgnify:CR=1 FL=1|uniref:Dolichyl-phosphate-mannose-protein mannosyltransferase n=1 Tax=Flexilinea flocculi TaxID=1678840 RepID=A0A0K8P9S9_9CHLR|nr:glycosyltransferase family 39 protein [Flexilinea flocculi]NMB92930.1 hypothetical protein [Flexilinea flocculi]GAP39396.1 dolichyl-phosphate-mannose-protein mannosyltransferase [Flexilinea flocculi]
MAQFRNRILSTKFLVDFIAILFILVFCLSGISTLTQYGATWDESLGNLFFGERYLHYFSSFDPNYLRFDEYLSMHKNHQLDLFKSPCRGIPHQFPALADTASAATMYVFSYKLKWLDPIDAFHLFPILLVSSFLVVFYFFISKRLGKWVGLFSILFMGTFPRLWGDMHFNVKDIPEMVFFGFALLAFWVWYENPSWKRAVLVGLAGGVALGVKANALFLPVTFILGFWPIAPKAMWNHIKTRYFQYILMLASGLITYFLSWPYLYSNPSNVKNYFSYIFSRGTTSASIIWNWQPLSITIAVIPEIMLLCLVIGLYFSIIQIRKKKEIAYRLALIWFLVPIIRNSIFSSVNFDGIRHFLEFVPAAALLAGMGAASIINLIGKQNKKTVIASGISLFLLTTINTAFIIKEFGSYQYIYFNKICGGLAGGKEKFGADEATDYWGSSYRKGLKWLSKNADRDSKLYVAVGDHIVKLVDSIWLRDDIEVIDAPQIAGSINKGKSVYIMFITRPSFYDPIALECLSKLDPVFEIRVNDVSILEIYKYNFLSKELVL